MVVGIEKGEIVVEVKLKCFDLNYLLLFKMFVSCKFVVLC